MFFFLFNDPAVLLYKDRVVQNCMKLPNLCFPCLKLALAAQEGSVEIREFIGVDFKGG